VANPYPARFIDDDGITSKSGEIDFTDPANQPGGGGSIQREQITGHAVSINNGATGTLTWDTQASGDALLDLSVPALPTVIAAGVYAFTLWVAPGAPLTAAGGFRVIFDPDLNGEDPGVAQDSSVSGAEATPNVTLSETYYMAAGATLQVRVVNNDGVNASNFSLLLGVVQRLS
jgi:hypothetical protein